MEEKDKQIQSLEKEVARLKRAMNQMDAATRKMHSRQIRTDERARRQQQEIDNIKNMLKRGR